jgi:hypothetical protein
MNRYLINLYQTIQIIQKGDFWGKNSHLGQFWDTNFLFFCEIQNWSGFADIAHGVHIDTFLVGLCAEMGLNMQWRENKCENLIENYLNYLIKKLEIIRYLINF